MVTALIVGTVLAAAALTLVLLPLFTGPSRGQEAVSAQSRSTSRAEEALRGAELDRATGLLSDADYAALAAEYAPAETAAGDAGAPGEPSAGFSTDEAIEALIARYRRRSITCPVTGRRATRCIWRRCTC